MKNFTCQFAINSYRRALAYYIAIITLLFAVFSVYVVAPSRQELEVGQAQSALSSLSPIENRKFSDYTYVYIPEINEHLKSSHSGWLPLWANKNELGRPLYQISGFSSAYFPTWIISHFIDNPWRLITTLSLSFCFLAGLFILLLSRELGLNPMAGLIAGINIASSPIFMYWLTFPMFSATWCWSSAALWAVTRLAKRYDLIGWSVLAFSAYSLLMTAYPQVVVYHAYLLGGYGLWLSYYQLQVNRFTLFKFLTLAATALIVGVTLAFPVYHDLFFISSESARVSPDISFFTIVVPKFVNFKELVLFFVLGTVPEIFGNPISTSFPFSYSGLSITITVIFFTTMGFLTALKKNWGWWLAILLICLLTFIQPFFVLAVKYLGFNLSRGTTFGSIMLPLTVISAFGIDSLTKSNQQSAKVKTVFISGLVTLLVILLGVIFGLFKQTAINWIAVALMMLVALMLVAQYKKYSPLLLITAVILVLSISSYPLMLKQNPNQMATSSPLVKTIKENLPTGSRYAVVAPGLSVLPPNFNATLGLNSIHSYNSLSSTRYHTLIKALGGEVQTYGRWNSSISPDFSSPMFWMSNISLILSPNTLEHLNLKALGSESGIYLYRVNHTMGESLQVPLAQQESNVASKKIVISDPRVYKYSNPIKIIDEGDILEFKLPLSDSSVFVLSQKFHRDWQATVKTNNGWQKASTIEINGVFQGVVLPSNTTNVRLEFKPLVRFAWIGHVFWFLLLIFTGFKSCRSYYFRTLNKNEKFK